MVSILLIVIIAVLGPGLLRPIVPNETGPFARIPVIDGGPTASYHALTPSESGAQVATNNITAPLAYRLAVFLSTDEPTIGQSVLHRDAISLGEKGFHPAPQATEQGLNRHKQGLSLRSAAIERTVVAVALLAGLAMVRENPTSDEPKLKRRARRRQRKLAGILRPPPKSSYKKLLGLLGLLLIVFLLLTTLAIYSYNQALEQTLLVEETLYTHRGHFDYTFSVAPSEQFVRQSGGFYELAAIASTDEQESAAMISLARTLELEFRYALEGLDEEQLWIEINGELLVRAGNGWRRDLTSLPVRSFAGRRGLVSTLVDMKQVRELIDNIEGQVEEMPSLYEIVFVPRVVIQGEDVDDVYQPEYVIEVENNQIRPSMELEHVEHRTEPVMTALSNTLPPVLGLTLSVERARALGLYGALTAGLATILLGSWIGWSLFTIPTARIAARYGKMLLEVDSLEDSSARRIRVQSIRDVARAAKRSGQPILHHESETHHMYCVADGENLYTYSLPKEPEEQ